MKKAESQTSQSEPEGNTKPSGLNQYYRWTFTLRQDDRVTVSQLSQLLREIAKQFYFQLEKGDKSDYYHYQGCFSLKTKERFTTVKNHFPNTIHLEPARDWFAAMNYCTKVDTRISGPWNHESVFVNVIKELRPWQRSAEKYCLETTNDRELRWYVDLNGGKGKTQFCKYMAVTHNATILGNGGLADLAFALPEDPKIVLFNFTRSIEGRVNYGALESVKDGMIFSAKYESKMKLFNSPVVIIFANFEPDLDTMSSDRWDVIIL